MMDWPTPGIGRPNGGHMRSRSAGRWRRDQNGYTIGELTKAELAERCRTGWRSTKKATAPGFAYCVGQHPGTTGALWIEGTEAREAYFRWADIPPDLIRKWNADRRRSSPIVRKLAKGAGAT